MAGLLSNPRDALAAQLRAQYNTGQGGSGSWDDAGVDRAAELADLLMKAGVTDLGQMSFVNTPYSEEQAATINAGRGGYDAATGQKTMPDLTLDELNATGANRKLKIGDKEVGFLGDYNNDGTFGNKAADYLGGNNDENLLGWSARGEGNTSYRVITDPTTGQLQIAPGWNSSSDASKGQKLALAAALAAGGVYAAGQMGAGAAAGGAGGASGLTGVDAAMADFAASGGGAGMGGGAAGGGIGTLAGAGSMPAVPGQVASLSTMGAAPASMSALAPAAAVPAALGGGGAALSGGGGLLSALGGAASEASPWLRTAAGLYGAYEGSQEQPGATTSQKMTMDPRLDSRAFGPGGLLESADAQFQKNKATGQNDTMRQGQDWLRGMLTSPGMAQGLQGQQQAAQRLFNLGPNPFTFTGRG